MAQSRREHVWEEGLHVLGSQVRVIEGVVRAIARQVVCCAVTGGCWARPSFALLGREATIQRPVLTIGTARTPEITLCRDLDESCKVVRDNTKLTGGKLKQQQERQVPKTQMQRRKRS